MSRSYTRRTFISSVTVPLIGITGCSALNPQSTQTLVIRNESESGKEISVGLKPESDSTIEPFQHTFSIEANESLRRKNVVPTGKYKYEVSLQNGKSQSGVWRMKKDHNEHTLVIEMKNRNGKIELHVVAVSH